MSSGPPNAFAFHAGHGALDRLRHLPYADVATDQPLLLELLYL
jgi:hypothetical protein